GQSTVTFNYENRCTELIWLGATPSIGDSDPEFTSGTSKTLQMPDQWKGFIWGRTKCSLNASNYFSCGTGDCGGNKICQWPVPNSPYKLQTNPLVVSYELNLNHGHNVPVRIQPVGGSLVGGSGPCPVVDCAQDFSNVCPPNLVAKGKDGRYTCQPNEYSSVFKKACGLAHTYPGAHSAKITFTNNCSKTIWPGTLTSDLKPQLSNTGFELLSKASLTLDVQAPWKGRFWARTQCSTNSTNFTCETADCGTGKVACNGTGAIPPASLVEINIADNRGMDYYDVSLVDGFNLPVSVATRGGTGDCKNSSCPADVNAVCPGELQVIGSDGSVAFGLGPSAPGMNHSIFHVKLETLDIRNKELPISTTHL
ncbi:thaumatin-like protein 1, partial [Quercus suber]